MAYTSALTPPSFYAKSSLTVKTRTAGQPGLIQPNAKNRYEVNRSDLPLSCPMPGMYLWNSHPRVYLPIENTGRAKCPYCGADYYLSED
jgi:uncharacterized Zn-finger protein